MPKYLFTFVKRATSERRLSERRQTIPISNILPHENATTTTKYVFETISNT